MYEVRAIGVIRNNEGELFYSEPYACMGGSTVLYTTDDILDAEVYASLSAKKWGEGMTFIQEVEA